MAPKKKKQKIDDHQSTSSDDKHLTPIIADDDVKAPSTQDNLEILKQVVGTDKKALAYEILWRTQSALPAGINDKAELVVNAMHELKPQDALEGMLCSQLISLHGLGMNYLRKAEKAEMRFHQDPDLNNAVKLLRLQHETIETLMRLRRKGEQKVIVQHVQVNDGGKAIVGDIHTGGGGHPQKIDEVIP